MSATHAFIARMSYREIGRALGGLSGSTVAMLEHSALTKVALALDHPPPPPLPAHLERVYAYRHRARRQNRCHVCGELGHNRLTCITKPEESVSMNSDKPIHPLALALGKAVVLKLTAAAAARGMPVEVKGQPADPRALDDAANRAFRSTAAEAVGMAVQGAAGFAGGLVERMDRLGSERGGPAAPQAGEPMDPTPRHRRRPGRAETARRRRA